MSVARWWEERLRSRQPLGYEVTNVDIYNVKKREGDVTDSWPKAIARSAFYTDYCLWFEERILGPLKDVSPYSDHPEKLPQCPNELAFFVIFGPWVYVRDKKSQVKNYWVWQSKQYEGRWVRVKVRRWFIRLEPFPDHVDAFRQHTGVDLRPREGSVPLT